MDSQIFIDFRLSKFTLSKGIGKPGKFLRIVSLLLFTILLIILDELLTDCLQTRNITWMILREAQPYKPFIAYLSFFYSIFWVIIYFWAAFRGSRPIRVILSLFYVLAIFIEYGYFKTFHRFMTTVDFWTAIYSPGSLWAEAIKMYIDWRALALSGLFLLVVAYNWNKPGSRMKPDFFIAGLFVSTLIFVPYTPYDQTMGSSLIQFTHLLGKIRLSERTIINRESVAQIEHNNPTNNIVLVIDESLRGDHISINGYFRETTPTLQKLKENGYITNWGLASSGATCSIHSNPLILTGVMPETKDRTEVSRWPTLFQFAHAMGYKTIYLDAQENYLWNGLTPSDKKFIDIWMDSDELGEDYLVDMHAAQFIRQEISDSVGRFIIVNKLGVHIKYENDYPTKEGHWFPTPPEGNYNKYPALVVNAYDNAIHFNNEVFFQTLLPDCIPDLNTVILYTSDHGETVQEKGETWPHCNNTMPEATVPLFIVARDLFDVDTRYQASHSNIFPTILDLMKVSESLKEKPYNTSLLRAKKEMNKPRYFLDGEQKPVLFSP